MTAPTEEKLTSSTLWSSTLPTDVSGRERRKKKSNLPLFWEMRTHQQRNCEKGPILFLVLQIFGSAASKTSTIGTQRSAVTLS
jgi:hypothetical protein